MSATNVFTHVFSRIGLVFKESGFPELCAKAWNCFVHRSVALPGVDYTHLT